MPVKATIKTGRPSSVVSGDLRELVEAELVGQPNFWPKPAPLKSAQPLGLSSAAGLGDRSKGTLC
jgi:hypothetical protein